MRRTILILTGLMVHGICTAQTAPGAAVAPSTAQQTMVRAAGMPLNDGSLAPGMLTVRIVRGAFAGNLSDQAVQLEMPGVPVETVRTDADGRAYFAHLPVGAKVRASADVDGQHLTSETFAMPADSGVRVLLVVDGEAGDFSGAPIGDPSMEVAATSAPTSFGQSGGAADSTGPVVPVGVTVVRVVLSMTTLGGIALVIFRRSLLRRQRP